MPYIRRDKNEYDDLDAQEFAAIALSFVIGGSLLAGMFFTLVNATNPDKKVKCDIEEPHAHVYELDSGLKVLMDSEVKSPVTPYSKYRAKRLEEYVVVSDEELKMIAYANEQQLYPIKENENYISDVLEYQAPHTEYEYMYIDKDSGLYTTWTNSNGTMVPQFIPTSSTDIDFKWTTDKTVSGKTGNVRDVTYSYQAYKIEKNEDGIYQTVASDEYENFADIPIDEYKFIKEDFYTINYREYRNEEDIIYDNKGSR